MFVRKFVKSIGLAAILAVGAGPVAAEKACSIAGHVDQLVESGWHVDRSHVKCAVDLAPELVNLMNNPGASAKPFAFEYRLVKEGAGPICASIAFERIKQGCEGDHLMTHAATSADDYINAILGGGDRIVTGSISE